VKFEFNRTNGRFAFSEPELSGVEIDNAIAQVHYARHDGRVRLATIEVEGVSIQETVLSDVHGNGRQVTILNQPRPDLPELIYKVNQYDNQPYVMFSLSIRNLSREPIFLHDMTLFQAGAQSDGHVRLAAQNQPLRFFKVGWHGWAYASLRNHSQRNTNTLLGFFTDASYTNPATPRTRQRGVFWSEGWGILAGENAALVAGFASTSRQFGQVYASTVPGHEVIALKAQADGILIDHGEEFQSDWGFLQFVSLSKPDPAEEYVRAVARQMRARVPASPPQPMWTHWYHFYHNINEELFIENLDTIAKIHATIPYQVVQLDDGYQLAWGDWTTCNAKFSHGLDSLASHIKDEGFTPGLWLAPFVVQPDAHVAQQHPDWLLKNHHGRPINSGFFYSFFGHALDTSHPAVLDHIRELMDTIAHHWGFGMVKTDFLYVAGLPGRRYNPKLTRAQSLRMGLEAIRQGLGEETFLLGCGCPFGPAIGIVDAMRIGPDTAPSWTPFFNWLPWAKPLIKGETSMPALRNNIRHTLNLSALHQRWWWNDPDCLMVRDADTTLTEAEVLSNVSLVGLSGGMLVSSDDLTKLDPARQKLISLLVPNLGNRGLPNDLLEHEMPEQYFLSLQAAGDDWYDVALFNWSDHRAERHLSFCELGFQPGTTLHVFDFWEKRYWLVKDAEMVFRDIPAHGCKMLRVCVVGNDPQVVGDTLHITQGAELASMSMNENVLCLHTLDLGRQVKGELWLWLPSEPLIATCNQMRVAWDKKAEMVYALHLQFVGAAKIEIAYQNSPNYYNA